MTTPTGTELPAEVVAAIRNGRTIEAIKLLREATGLGLKEAKDAVEAYAQGRPLVIPETEGVRELPAAVRAAMRGGNKIEAIRLLRDATGMGLKEAKDAVEAAEIPLSATRRAAPGEVKRGSGVIWLALVIAALGALAYFYFNGS